METAIVITTAIKIIIDFIVKAIESGTMDVELLRKKPLEYFVTKAGEALKAQSEAETHLPD